MLYVDDYSSAGYTGDEAEGNFLAIHAETVEEGTTITVEVVGGVHGPSTLDADGLCICRIANTNQKIKVVATKDGYSTTEKIYRLTHLTLESD